MEKHYCKECQNYKQHYALDQKKIYRVYCGHCMRPKIRHKRPDAVACDFFLPKKSEESAFASKEYLSKELLSYMMRLELLPEIQDALF